MPSSVLSGSIAPRPSDTWSDNVTPMDGKVTTPTMVSRRAVAPVPTRTLSPTVQEPAQATQPISRGTGRSGWAGTTRTVKPWRPATSQTKLPRQRVVPGFGPGPFHLHWDGLPVLDLVGAPHRAVEQFDSHLRRLQVAQGNLGSGLPGGAQVGHQRRRVDVDGDDRDLVPHPDQVGLPRRQDLGPAKLLAVRTSARLAMGSYICLV